MINEDCSTPDTHIGQVARCLRNESWLGGYKLINAGTVSMLGFIIFLNGARLAFVTPWALMWHTKNARHENRQPILELDKALLDTARLCEFDHGWKWKVIHFTVQCHQISLVIIQDLRLGDCFELIRCHFVELSSICSIEIGTLAMSGIVRDERCSLLTRNSWLSDCLILCFRFHYASLDQGKLRCMLCRHHRWTWLIDSSWIACCRSHDWRWLELVMEVMTQLASSSSEIPETLYWILTLGDQRLVLEMSSWIGQSTKSGNEWNILIQSWYLHLDCHLHPRTSLLGVEWIIYSLVNPGGRW